MEETSSLPPVERPLSLPEALLPIVAAIVLLGLSMYLFGQEGGHGPHQVAITWITLQNANEVPLVNASVTDPLPGDATNGVIVAPVPNASTTCAGGTVEAVPGSQTITLTGGTIPARVLDVPGTYDQCRCAGEGRVHHV